MRRSISRVSVIGLGAMGNPISTRLLAAGYPVTGRDIVEERMNGLVPLGLRTSKSPSDAAKGVDLVLLSLPNWETVLEVVEGDDGVLESARKGLIIVDMSTVPPWETRAMGSKLEGKGIDWMDVPVSGSSNQAREGNLVFMAGGNESTFTRVKPVLDAIGKKSVYVGKHGDAAMLKLVANLVLFINQAAAIEGLVLGLKAGLSPGIILEVLMSGAAASDLIVSRGKDMIKGSFEPKGSLRIAVKDISLALECAKHLGVILPMAGLYQQFLLSALCSGWEGCDATVVMRIYDRLAGVWSEVGNPSGVEGNR